MIMRCDDLMPGDTGGVRPADAMGCTQCPASTVVAVVQLIYYEFVGGDSPSKTRAMSSMVQVSLRSMR